MMGFLGKSRNFLKRTWHWAWQRVSLNGFYSFVFPLLQSMLLCMGSQACCSSRGHKVRHDLRTEQQLCIYFCIIKLIHVLKLEETKKSGKENIYHATSKMFPCGSAGKESACNAGDLGLIPGLGRSPGEGKGEYSSILAWRIPLSV